jgi:hypothetical protein
LRRAAEAALRLDRSAGPSNSGDRAADALPTMLRLITVRDCRTMSDRSSAGFLKLSVASPRLVNAARQPGDGPADAGLVALAIGLLYAKRPVGAL